MMLPLVAPYSQRALTDWCELHRPKQIGMTDGQYAWLGNLMCANVRTYHAIPIIFLDAPQQ